MQKSQWKNAKITVEKRSVIMATIGTKTVTQLVNQGMEVFRCGNIKESIVLFDRAMELDPSLHLRLWQRGLSLYYAGKYQDAANQFEVDVISNPNDTEEVRQVQKSIYSWIAQVKQI